MVGEIRDGETAQMAIEASLTGHLVLSHAAHQQRARDRDAAARHGHGPVQLRRLAARRAGAAPGAPAVQQVRAGAAGHASSRSTSCWPTTCTPSATARRQPKPDDVLAGWHEALRQGRQADAPRRQGLPATATTAACAAAPACTSCWWCRATIRHLIQTGARAGRTAAHRAGRRHAHAAPGRHRQGLGRRRRRSRKCARAAIPEQLRWGTVAAPHRRQRRLTAQCSLTQTAFTAGSRRTQRFAEKTRNAWWIQAFPLRRTLRLGASAVNEFACRTERQQCAGNGPSIVPARLGRDGGLQCGACRSARCSSMGSRSWPRS